VDLARGFLEPRVSFSLSRSDPTRQGWQIAYRRPGAAYMRFCPYSYAFLTRWDLIWKKRSDPRCFSPRAYLLLISETYSSTGGVHRVRRAVQTTTPTLAQSFWHPSHPVIPSSTSIRHAYIPAASDSRSIGLRHPSQKICWRFDALRGVWLRTSGS